MIKDAASKARRELLYDVVVAMNAGNGNLENITGTVHVHPALSEVVLRAGLSAREGLQH